MREFVKRLFITALATFLVLSVVSHVYGKDKVTEEDLQKEITETNTSSVEITVSVPSSFSLSIPKTIKLIENGTNNSTAIYHMVMETCDIAPNEYVLVTAPEQFDLTESQSGLIVNVSNSMSSEIFTGKLENEIREGTLQTGHLRAGTWRGLLTFHIQLVSKDAGTLGETMFGSSVSN